MNKLVCIRSYDEKRFVSALILDASNHQTSITMSLSDASLFNVTVALDRNSYERDGSFIFVSFATTLVPNTYLRHEDGRIKLRKDDQSILFREDSTFKLLQSDKTRGMVAFEPINVRGSYLTVDSDSKSTLVIEAPKSKMVKTIDELERRFLFKLVCDK